MKKNLSILIGLLTASGAMAQSSDLGPVVNSSGYGVNHGWFGQGGTTILTGGDLWLRNDDWIPTEGNITVASGNSAIQMGKYVTGAQWTWVHDLTGRFHDMNTDDNNSANTSTHFIYSDDSSTLTGSTTDRTGWSGSKTDNAVTVLHRDLNYGRRMGSYTFYDGIYQGGDGFHGAHFHLFNSFSAYEAAFIAGDHVASRTSDKRNQGMKVTVSESGVSKSTGGGQGADDNAASGAWMGIGSGSIYISNRTGVASDRFQASTYISSMNESTGNGARNVTYTMRGGDGLTALDFEGDATIDGGDFIGTEQASGVSRYLEADTFDQYGITVDVRGGSGVAFSWITGGVDINDGNFVGGVAGSGLSSGEESTVRTFGGHGAAIQGGGANNLLGGSYYGGVSGSATVTPVGRYSITNAYEYTTISPTAANSQGYAHGASGIYLYNTGKTIVDITEAYGTRGGTASIAGSNSYANASGGNGLYAYSTDVDIKGGQFYGSDGGAATASAGTAEAYGGAGVYVDEGDLAISGGEFIGGKGGSANGLTTGNTGNIGVMVRDGSLTINTNDTETLITGDVVLNNTGTESLSITGGEISGDIYKLGAGLANVSVGTNATYSGSFLQQEGDSAVSLSNEAESKFFTDVEITDGSMTFSGARVLIADNASFTLGGASNKLDFGTAGAAIGKNASISAGYNQVISGSDLDLGEDSVLSFNFDSLTGVAGGLDVTGTLYATNKNARIRAAGISAVPEDTFLVAKAGTVVGISASNVYDVVEVDFGWLTQNDTNALSLAGGITVGYKYNSLTNTTLADLGTILTNVDNTIIGLTNTEFFALNSLGEDNGDKLFRFSLSQIPDVSERSFQVSQQLNEQIAARGTEFRSMNGFASSKPKFSTSPTGVAGPQNELEEEKTMQGWVRAYGGTGSKDKTGSFAEYDTTSWGSVIGIDKSFGNLLIGLAGGYARTDLDAGTAYNADVDTYHGSVYSTFGGEDLFVDVALTYGWSSTDENNGMSDASFDSSLYSAYIGAGYALDLGEKIALTPEASLLASYYDQEAYKRDMGSLGTGEIRDYDTTSFLGSIGVNLATQHQLDWLNRGIAYIPEVRAHYIHEFNADPDKFTYDLGGAAGTFAVRTRDEHLFRFGFGFDLWSWKYQNTKFEIDYDLLTSDTYFEQIVSGKATWRF
ncbi:autotransporter domain-containing protein [Pontiellaceae bacterium B12227]|nr:autotransporter domain-containing protein [Pontiellaceae bacterium B12227]